MKKTLEIILTVLGVLLGALVIDMIFAYPVMLLWNWLMPTIFGLPVVTFWQSLGLMFLSSLLFGSKNSTKTD